VGLRPSGGRRPHARGVAAAFAAGELHTGFIDEHLGELTPRPCPPAEALAALAAVLQRPASVGTAARAASVDPWASLGRWRLGEDA
jgi:3-methylcrotonyl-CoA carboxylase alpha subunit